MKASLVFGVAAVLSLGGCQKVAGIAAGDGPSHHGRYEGAGVYTAGRMWRQLVRANPPTDATGSGLKDDEEVIVVIDSRTGELRQCGNLSGYCVAMSPWAKPLATQQQTPIPLLKHADQLDQEAEAQDRRFDVQLKQAAPGKAAPAP